MLNNLKKTTKKRIKIYIVACTAVLVLIGAIVVQTVTPGLKWFFTPKAKAKDGVLENVGVEHIKDVPAGEIKYIINNNVTLKDDNSKGNFMFENPESCEYTIQFVVYKVVGEQSEEVVMYTSPMIAPGQYVSEDKLDIKTEAGEYACMYFARAYLDGEYIGEKSGDMTITVSE